MKEPAKLINKEIPQNGLLKVSQSPHLKVRLLRKNGQSVREDFLRLVWICSGALPVEVPNKTLRAIL